MCAYAMYYKFFLYLFIKEMFIVDATDSGYKVETKSLGYLEINRDI